MSSRLGIAGIVLLAAFGLAACGGGGGGTATDPGPTLQEQLDQAQQDLEQARQALEEARQNQETTQDELDEAEQDLDTAEQTAALFETAARTFTAGAAALAKAEKAVKTAVKYSGMLDTMSVKGDSAQAADNAQAVLDAGTDANQAVMEAEANLAAAKMAKATADDLGNQVLIDTLSAAVMDAEAQVKATTAARDATDIDDATTGNQNLKTSLAAVQNPGAADPAPDPLKGPKYHNDQVAMAIGGALQPTSATDGSGLRVVDGASSLQAMLDASPRAPSLVVRTDREGMTWVAIAQDLGLTTQIRRTGRFDNNGDVDAARPTRSVLAAVVSGLDNPNTSTIAATHAQVNDDLVVASDAAFRVTMFGLEGTLFCQRGSCRLSADGTELLAGEPYDWTDPATGEVHKITPDWFFAPNDSFSLDNLYVANPATPGTYMIETNFVRYGYWLSENSGDSTLFDVNTYAVANTGTNTSGLTFNVVTGAPATATFSGRAVGMSVHKTFNAQDNTVDTITSGEFTANVDLTAKFGTTPTLGGMVSNFVGGGAVDPDWSVTLEETAIDNSAGNFATPGVAKGSGQAGQWTTQAWGTSGQRPTGFFGRFNAHFTDGHVAGAYATRKD